MVPKYLTQATGRMDRDGDEPEGAGFTFVHVLGGGGEGSDVLSSRCL